MTHAGEMMVMINDHFGGPSVHSAQILRKNPGTGQTPLSVWQCQDFGIICSPNPSLLG